METIIRLSPSELTTTLLQKIQELIAGKEDVDITISLKEHDAAYARELDESIEQAESAHGLTSFTMEEFLAYKPADKP